MGVGQLDVVGHLDVGQLRAPDRLLLILGAQRVPGGHVVQVLLHDDVAAAGEVRIGVADQRRRPGRPADRVLGAVDEAEQVALVEVAESVHLVHHGDRPGQPGHGLGDELKTQVHPLVPDVEEQVTRRGGGMVHGAGERAERVQLGRARAGEQAIPGARGDAGDAGHRRARGAEADRPPHGGPVAEQVPDDGFPAGLDRQHQEDRGVGERGHHRLRLGLRQGPRDSGNL